MNDDPVTDLVQVGPEIVRDPRVQQMIAVTVGAPVREAAAWLTDQIRYLRWTGQVRILQRATEFLERAGIEPGRVDPSVLVPLIESGSLQEDESMVDRWAALLATAATDPGTVPPSYPDILRQLTPREAAILDGVYEEMGHTWEDGWTYGESLSEPEALAERAGFSTNDIVLSVENLLRLRLLRSGALIYPGFMPNDSKVLLTRFGHSFVSACRPPRRSVE